MTCRTDSKSTITKARPSASTAGPCCGGWPGKASSVRVSPCGWAGPQPREAGEAGPRAAPPASPPRCVTAPEGSHRCSVPTSHPSIPRGAKELRGADQKFPFPGPSSQAGIGPTAPHSPTNPDAPGSQAKGAFSCCESPHH